MNIKKLFLESTQLEALKRFYTGIFDLPILDEHPRSFTVQAGKTQICFSKARGKEQPFYHFAFNIPENQIAEAQQWLSGRVELLRDQGKTVIDFPAWNAEALYFIDPGGNIVEFIARHNLKNARKEPFSSRSLICVSEIGVPVESVALFCDYVAMEMNLPFYSGDRKRFAALGDEEGLFIVVPIGREWYPTQIKSEKYTAQVEIEE